MPCTFPAPCSAVITVTPVANCASASRNSAELGDLEAVIESFDHIILEKYDVKRWGDRCQFVHKHSLLPNRLRRRWLIASLETCIGSNNDMARKISILGGTGPEGWGLANRLARAGEAILIGSRDAQRAQESARQLREQIGGAVLIEGTDNASAASNCDVAILTIPFSGQVALLKQLRGVWKPGTVVIDTTVPLAASIGGAPTRTLGVWQGSAAEAAAELLPKGISIVAALHNLGAELLAGNASVECDVLVCSDEEPAKQLAMELVRKIPGVRALNGGKLENARIVESVTALLIGLNIRYKVHSAGIRFTGLPL
jgi:NADPH-dependent F420 reductase